MNKLAHFITHRPKLIIIISLLLLIPSVIAYANTFVNYDILSYLPKELDSVKGTTILDESFKSASMSMLIVEDMPAKDVSALKEKVESIEGVSEVMWIDDLLGAGIPDEFLPDSIREIFYSADGRYTMMLVKYSGDSASADTMKAIDNVRSVMNKQCFLSGMSALLTDTKQLADREAPIYIAIAVAIALVVMSLCMESYILPFVILVSLGIAIIYNMGTNIFLGQISYITQSIAAILQLGVTMDYSVFLIDRFTEERKRCPDSRDAMANAIKASFTSLTGSSLTTVFGFLALCFMKLTLGLDIGLVMAKGVVFGVATVILVLPAFVLLFEKRIYKYSHKSLIPRFDRTSSFVTKHKKVFTAVFLLLFIPAYLAQTQTQVYYDLSSSLPEDLPSVAGLATLKREFNMATSHFVILDENDMTQGEIADLTDSLCEIDGVEKVVAYSTFAGPAIPDSMVPDSLKAICKTDGRQMILVNSTYSPATDEVNAQIDEITSLIKSYSPNNLVTGEGVLYKDLIDVTAVDFKVTNIISILAIFILVAICFKSISLPVLLVAAIELAIYINMAISYFMGVEIPFISPTVVGCVQLGATVDYAILLTSRFKEELQGGADRLTAMRAAANASSRSILQSALVFFGATFGVYLFCDIEIIKSICSMLARGALISGAVIIVFLTPTLLCFEKLISKTTYKWRVKFER
ncbi:MAG: MMPL family transporter [Clostridiales bacterium]|nr:MMPL family transporter [Clostridiales bacterium]